MHDQMTSAIWMTLKSSFQVRLLCQWTITIFQNRPFLNIKLETGLRFGFSTSQRDWRLGQGRGIFLLSLSRDQSICPWKQASLRQTLTLKLSRKGSWWWWNHNHAQSIQQLGQKKNNPPTLVQAESGKVLTPYLRTQGKRVTEQQNVFINNLIMPTTDSKLTMSLVYQYACINMICPCIYIVVIYEYVWPGIDMYALSLHIITLLCLLQCLLMSGNSEQITLRQLSLIYDESFYCKGAVTWSEVLMVMVRWWVQVMWVNGASSYTFQVAWKLTWNFLHSFSLQLIGWICMC